MVAEIDWDKDKTHLLGIFPEEIWLMMWESLEDQDDQQNFSNASLFLRQVVASKRTTYLFPNVWRILGLDFEESEKADYNANIPPGEEDDYGAFMGSCDTCAGPRFLAPFTELLTMRHVCRTWCDAIYPHCDPSVFEADVDLSDLDSLFHWRLQFFDSLHRTESDFQQFERHFENTHGDIGACERSPFPARALSIVHGRPNYGGRTIDGQPFFDQLASFLLKYGRNVQYCNIQIWLEAPVNDTYARLNLWLGRMPNLKTLELNIIGKCTEANAEPFVPSRREKALLRKAIRLNPLPVIHSLEFIKIRSCPKVIFSELMRQNGHISKLKIYKRTEHEDHFFSDVQSVNIPLQDLEKLDTTVKSESTLIDLMDPLQACPLNKLNLEIDVRHGYIDWQGVFDILQGSENTLTDLVLKLPDDFVDPRPGQTSPCRQLKLPHVTRLELTLYSYQSLDFIFPMRNSLQYFEVKVVQIWAEETKMKVLKRFDMRKIFKFFSRLDKPMESNIWKKCPRLKQIRYYEIFEAIVHGEMERKENLIWSHRRGD